MPIIDFTQARPNDVAGIRRRRIVQYTGPASYATGGDLLVPSDVTLGVIEDLPEQSVTDGTSVRTIIYNNTTQKLQWFVPNTNVDVAAGVNLSTFIGRFAVTGP